MTRRAAAPGSGVRVPTCRPRPKNASADWYAADLAPPTRIDPGTFRMRPGAERGSVVMTRPVGSQSLDSRPHSPWTRFSGTQGRRLRSARLAHGAPPAHGARAPQDRLPRLVRIESRPIAPDPTARSGLLPLAERGCCVTTRPESCGRLGSFPTSPSTRFWANPRPGTRPDRQGGAKTAQGGTQTDRPHGARPRQEGTQTDRPDGAWPCQGGAPTDVDVLCGVVGSAVRYRWLNAVAADEAFKSATCDRLPPNVCSVRA